MNTPSVVDLITLRIRALPERSAAYAVLEDALIDALWCHDNLDDPTWHAAYANLRRRLESPAALPYGQERRLIAMLAHGAEAEVIAMWAKAVPT